MYKIIVLINAQPINTCLDKIVLSLHIHLYRMNVLKLFFLQIILILLIPLIFTHLVIFSLI